MSTSLKFHSPEDPENQVLVTKDKNWTSIKLYANGALQYEANNAESLRSGHLVNVEDYGTIELKLRSELEVTVNNVPYIASQKEVDEKVTNVSTIFWILTGFSFFGLIMMYALGSEIYAPDFLMFLLGVQLFATLVYGTTAILLKKGVYWFYFVGAGLYTFFTALEFVDIDSLLAGRGILGLLIRVTLLVLVLRILPIILKKMKTGEQDQSGGSIIDQ